MCQFRHACTDHSFKTIWRSLRFVPVDLLWQDYHSMQRNDERFLQIFTQISNLKERQLLKQNWSNQRLQTAIINKEPIIILCDCLLVVYFQTVSNFWPWASSIKQQVCQELRLGLKLDLETGYLMRLRYWIIHKTWDREKRRIRMRRTPKNRSTQLSALCLASAGNGNHDKNKEITHWVYFQMNQRKSLTRKIWHKNLADPAPPGLHLDKVVLRCNVCI